MVDGVPIAPTHIRGNRGDWLYAWPGKRCRSRTPGLPIALPVSMILAFWLSMISGGSTSHPISRLLDLTSEFGWRLDVLHESPFKRSSERHSTKAQASLITNFRGHLQRHPCLIVEVSRGGYRLRGGFRIKRGQVVEVIPKDDPLSVAKCSVIWVGKEGTPHQGHAGLEAIE